MTPDDLLKEIMRRPGQPITITEHVFREAFPGVAHPTAREVIEHALAIQIGMSPAPLPEYKSPGQQFTEWCIEHRIASKFDEQTHYTTLRLGETAQP